MRIGLYDVNKSSYGKMRYEFPEIDLMKVFSYYKKNKNNIIELSQDFHNYKNYDLFYIFNNKRHIVSKDLLNLQNQPNVYLVGTCFYGDIWYPMNDEIEKCEPDITSYSAFLRENIIKDTLAPWTATLFTDYYYLRYFYPDWHWNLITEKIKNKKIILYDFDLTSNEGWQELCLRLKRESGRNFVCRHEVIVRDTDTLHFIVKNQLYKTSTKYPTKFIIDVPEVRENFKEYFDSQFEYFDAFPMNSLFIYQNHSKIGETEVEKFARLVDNCMYALNHNVEIYPIYDNSMPPKIYDLFVKRITYYFTMRKTGTILEKLKERGDPTNFLKEIQEQAPLFYNKISNITRTEVKSKQKEWIYGER